MDGEGEPMSRLIDGDELLEILRIMKERYFDRKIILGKVVEEVKRMPTIDPERKKGKWIPAFDGKFRGGAYWFNCSECGHIVAGGLQSGNFFCENCGADMREGEQE